VEYEEVGEVGRRLPEDLLVNLLPVRMRVEVLRVRGCVGQLVEA